MHATRITIMCLALSLLAFGPAGRAEPGEPEGFICVSTPAAQAPPFKCSYIATVKGMYTNAGSWSLVIKRGCRSDGTHCKKIITITSRGKPGGIDAKAPGVIRKGDRVTGTLKAYGTQMSVGSATGT